jgi:hypothetical protein
MHQITPHTSDSAARPGFPFLPLVPLQITHVLAQLDRKHLARAAMDVSLKRERALKVVSVRLDMPAVQEDITLRQAWGQSHSLATFFSSRARSRRCALCPHLFVLNPCFFPPRQCNSFFLFRCAARTHPRCVVRIGPASGQASDMNHGVRRGCPRIFTHNFLGALHRPRAESRTSEDRHGVPCSGARTYVRCSPNARVVLALEVPEVKIWGPGERY